MGMMCAEGSGEDGSLGTREKNPPGGRHVAANPRLAGRGASEGIEHLVPRAKLEPFMGGKCVTEM